MSKNLPTTPRNLPSIDFRKGDAPELITIIFGKSNSYYYKYALKTAHDSDHFQDIDDMEAGRLAHQAYYKQSRESAEKALALLTIVSGWKGTRVSHNGNLLTKKWPLMETLRCYIDASLCNDYRAHCYTTQYVPEETKPFRLGKITIDTVLQTLADSNSSETRTNTYLIPCKRVVGLLRFKRGFDIKRDDSVQAAAIERCCHFCPLFDETKTRKL